MSYKVFVEDTYFKSPLINHYLQNTCLNLKKKYIIYSFKTKYINFLQDYDINIYLTAEN
ncbi:MAG: hypothetical protein ACMXX9_01180 [Candidatus Woesearchaeota archaeon]